MRFLKLCLMILSFPIIVYGAFDKLDIGGRPVGLGGSFVALSDDLYSIYYNPAGLAGLKNIHLLTTYNQPYGMEELILGHVAFAYNLKAKGTYALGFKTLNFLGYYSENTITFAHGFLFKRVKLGYGIDMKIVSIGGDDSELKGSDYTIGVNLGTIISIVPNKLQFGVYFMNINNSRISEKYPEPTASSLEAGIAFFPNDRLTITSELYKDINAPIQFKFGQEFKLNKYLVLRAGIQNEPSRLALGFGFKIKQFELDYAYFDHPQLVANHFFTFSMQFGAMPITVEEEVEEGKININTATVGELMQLPRIGSSTANKIIEYREQVGGFKSIEEIKNVRGIGDATFNQIKDLITVGKVKIVVVREEVPESEKIDINTASEVELQALPSIGPSKARAIVEYREQYGEFDKIEDIMKVRGIGPGTFEKFKHLITVRAVMPEEEKAPEVKEEIKEELRININTATYDQLMSIPGMKSNIARYIIRYRERRGEFRKKEDLLLLPVVSRRFYNSIKDKIAVEREVEVIEKKETPIEEAYQVDVNTASVEDFEDFGIGEEYAKKIVEYREKMGSYTDLEQVRKAAGMDEVTFRLIKDFLTIKIPSQSKGKEETEQKKEVVPPSTDKKTESESEQPVQTQEDTVAEEQQVEQELEIGKINLNKATKDELLGIGIDKDKAKKVVDFLKKGNKFNSIDELQKFGFEKEEIQMLKDFLTIE